jgi:quinol-cytochrome oxidoreductase complex cytochrome b subunit
MMAYVRRSQIWKSIFRHGYPDTARNRTLAVFSNVFLHLHPVQVRKSGIRLSYTWCMGGITFFLFLVEAITGILLMFYYRPVGDRAFQDIVALREHVPLGIMREVHRWAAHAMVISVWLHMFRVFLTGSYKPPREFNWNVGVILLVLTLLLSFTGYLLPWDSSRSGRSRWGATWRGRRRSSGTRGRAPRCSRWATSSWCTRGTTRASG